MGNEQDIKVYTLTGKSGTGKSFQAMNLCRELGIESIVDDGLFICGDKVIAGSSAKREKTKVGAIKAAMFIREKERNEVRAGIDKVSPASILVIATSDKMAEEIVRMLELPEISRVIHIEDITTEREREKAYKQRRIQGKHVIPVPSMQLKRDFAGYFMNPLKILKTTGVFGLGQYTEKTVVRPTYSYRGNFYISDRVIEDIARIVADEMQGVGKVRSIYANTMPGTLKIEADIELKGHASRYAGSEIKSGSGMTKPPATVWERAEAYQRKLKEMVESMTSFNVVEVDVTVSCVTAY